MSITSLILRLIRNKGLTSKLLLYFDWAVMRLTWVISSVVFIRFDVCIRFRFTNYSLILFRFTLNFKELVYFIILILTNTTIASGWLSITKILSLMRIINLNLLGLNCSLGLDRKESLYYTFAHFLIVSNFVLTYTIVIFYVAQKRTFYCKYIWDTKFTK